MKDTVVDPGFGQRGGVGPNSGSPNFADVAEQSHVSEASICRCGIWAMP